MRCLAAICFPWPPGRLPEDCKPLPTCQGRKTKRAHSDHSVGRSKVAQIFPRKREFKHQFSQALCGTVIVMGRYWDMIGIQPTRNWGLVELSVCVYIYIYIWYRYCRQKRGSSSYATYLLYRLSPRSACSFQDLKVKICFLGTYMYIYIYTHTS